MAIAQTRPAPETTDLEPLITALGQRLDLVIAQLASMAEALDAWRRFRANCLQGATSDAS